jgi:sortase A
VQTDRGSVPAPSPSRQGRVQRRPLSVVGVLGELLVTVGAVVLLYVGWQMWFGDVIYGAQAHADSRALSEQWAAETLAPAPNPTTTDPLPSTVAEAPTLPQPADGEDFAVMWIPRLGADYSFKIAGGVSRARTLDKSRIGHYPDSAMPGDVGNFALAAHRTTFGAPFNRIADLHVGDAIILETQNGWYTYRFRTLEYVKPTAVDVLLPVPRKPDVPAGEKFITMTSCSPMYAMSERIVAYGLFDAYQPREAGPPTSLSAPTP